MNLLRTVTQDGHELVLHEREGVFTIRFNGRELISSHTHRSEEALARLACIGLEERPRPRVLVGGLGMGFTLRAALDVLPVTAAVDVVEVFAPVIQWCRGPLATLARNPLNDPRVEVIEGDVAQLLRLSRDCFDAVILDVDNGPQYLTLTENSFLYGQEGLGRAHKALRSGGRLAMWSADIDPGLRDRMERAGFRVMAATVGVRPDNPRVRHTVYVGRKASRSLAATFRKPDPIEWDDSYSVGVKALDIQHQRIVRLINVLIEAGAAEVNSELVSDTLTEMTQYAEDHFRIEEGLLASHDYPQLDEHREEHLEFRQRIAELALETMEGRPTVALELLAFLRELWHGHVLETDMLYKRFLNQRGVR
jgi:hemerythrin-like metal-binding protein